MKNSVFGARIPAIRVSNKVRPMLFGLSLKYVFIQIINLVEKTKINLKIINDPIN